MIHGQIVLSTVTLVTSLAMHIRSIFAETCLSLMAVLISAHFPNCYSIIYILSLAYVVCQLD